MERIESTIMVLPKGSLKQSKWILTSIKDNIIAAVIALITCMTAWQTNDLDFVLNHIMVLLPLTMLFLSSSSKRSIKLTTLMCIIPICFSSASFNFSVAFLISCLLTGFLNMRSTGIVDNFVLITAAILTAITGFLLIGATNLSLWFFQNSQQLQLIMMLVFLIPITLLGRLNWSCLFFDQKNKEELDRKVLSNPYKDLCERYYLLTQRLLENRDRCVSQFKDIRFLIDSTEKLIFHGDRIYQLCLPRRMQQLKEKYTQLSMEPIEVDVSSSRLNHLTEIEIQIKYFEETISFEKKIFDQIETILLIFERIELSLLRSESAKISLSSSELTKTSYEIQQSLDALRDNVEGLIDLSH